MNINKGSLELSDSDFDNIISNITQGNSTLKSLEINADYFTYHYLYHHLRKSFP